MAQAAWPRAKDCPPVNRASTCRHDAAGPADVSDDSGDTATRRWSHGRRPRPTGPQQDRKRRRRDARHRIAAPGGVRQLQSVILADV